jgi:uncharacterized delta-60 repeat protein
MQIIAFVRKRSLLAIVTTCCLGCTGEDGGHQLDGLEVVFDGDGFADDLVSVRVPTRFTPVGVVAGPDGSLFLHGHAAGDGNDAAPNGHNVVIELRPDGRPDDSFGDGGVFALGEAREGFVDLAVLPDASTVALGSIDGRPAAWKLTADGLLDASFGENGLVEIDIDGSNDDSARPIAVVVRDDSSLDIVGMKVTDDTSHPFAARVSTTGAVEVARAYPSVPDTWRGVLLDSGGSTLVFGERSTATGVQPLVGRLTGALELDTAFGPDGYARVGAVESYCRRPVAVPGGGFAAAGSRGQGGDFAGAVLMLTAGGDLDPSFDGDGHLAIDEDSVAAVVPLASGGLLAQLQSTSGTPEPPEYVVRITAAGAIDPSFADAGRSTGKGVALGLATTADGETYAAAFEWPDTAYVRRISSAARRSRMRSQ